MTSILSLTVELIGRAFNHLFCIKLLFTSKWRKSSEITLKKNQAVHALEGQVALQLSYVFSLLQSWKRGFPNTFLQLNHPSWIVCCWQNLVGNMLAT